jgi:hypothetical protein
MLKKEYIDQINDFVTPKLREARALFADANEEQIYLHIEKFRRVYLAIQELGVETAKTRNLKRLKEMGESTPIPRQSLVERHSTPKQGKVKQTKEEKLESSLANLGLDMSAFMDAMRKKLEKK